MASVSPVPEPGGAGANLVVELRQAASASLAAVGGKALNLGRLAAADFPVTPGFCLTTAAYRKAAQAGLAAFLSKYGHRAVAEIDLGMPRWAEEPDHLLGMISNYLRVEDPEQAPDGRAEPEYTKVPPPVQAPAPQGPGGRRGRSSSVCRATSSRRTRHAPGLAPAA
ncbi:PEP/pyruvate-binding domain-containing protein [Arthrobacter liuii]|uniref:Pyruvate, water dikinase n=1 Tax=Arthrobacter liuii TaxID=1476996 RepID=A0ABQ2AZY2_9MICC|nr:PEP/pyruvate-binding domain-containing protein [Arthrobacter liuii]GGI01621.1 hypothetical protein GCM10007170_41480 [Arthrobacter liuii]